MKKIPQPLSEFKEGMFEFGQTIAIIINSVLLLLVYFIGVGPTSVIAKLAGKEFLDTERIGKTTYWVDTDSSNRSDESYYSQF